MYLSTVALIVILEVFLLLLGLAFFLVLHIRTLNRRQARLKAQLQDALATTPPTTPDNATTDTTPTAPVQLSAADDTSYLRQIIEDQLTLTQQLQDHVMQAVASPELSAQLSEQLEQLEDLIQQGKDGAEQFEATVAALKNRLAAASPQGFVTPEPAPPADIPPEPEAQAAPAKPDTAADAMAYDAPVSELTEFELETLEEAIDASASPPSAQEDAAPANPPAKS